MQRKGEGRDDPEMWLTMSYVSYLLGDSVAGKLYFEKFYNRMKPEESYLTFAVYMFDYLVKKREFSQARKLMEIYPGLDGESEYHLEEDGYEATIENLLRLTREDPLEMQHRSELARIYLENGKMEEAAQAVMDIFTIWGVYEQRALDLHGRAEVMLFEFLENDEFMRAFTAHVDSLSPFSYIEGLAEQVLTECSPKEIAKIMIEAKQKDSVDALLEVGLILDAFGKNELVQSVFSEVYRRYRTGDIETHKYRKLKYALRIYVEGLIVNGDVKTAKEIVGELLWMYWDSLSGIGEVSLMSVRVRDFDTAARAISRYITLDKTGEHRGYLTD